MAITYPPEGIARMQRLAINNAPLAPVPTAEKWLPEPQ